MNKLLTKIVGVALGATMAVGVGVAAVKGSEELAKPAFATDATVVFEVTEWSGSTSTSQINGNTLGYGTITGTSTTVAGYMHGFKPSNGQVRGNKTKVGTDSNSNWHFYNSVAISGAIKSVVVEHTATGTNKFQNNLYLALGTSTQANVTDVSSGTAGTRTDTTFSWNNLNSSSSFSYLKLYSNEKFTSGTVTGVTVTVTYVVSTAPVVNISGSDYLVDGGNSGTLSGTISNNNNYTITWSASPSTGVTIFPTTSTSGNDVSISFDGVTTGTTPIVITATLNNPGTQATNTKKIYAVEHSGTSSDPFTATDAQVFAHLDYAAQAGGDWYVQGYVVNTYLTNKGYYIDENPSNTSSTKFEVYNASGVVNSTGKDIIVGTSYIVAHGSATCYNGQAEIGDSVITDVDNGEVPSVVINGGDRTVDINDSLTLTATTEHPNDAVVTWTSSVTSVATIDSSTGEVTLLSVGTTIITASITVSGTTYTNTITLKVESCPVQIGKTYTISAVYQGSTYYFTGVSGDIGLCSTNQNDAMILTVEAGNEAGSFAFQNSGNYLKAKNGNNLLTETEISDDSSWLVSNDGTKDIMLNVGQSSRLLSYNDNGHASDPTRVNRFAAYNAQQSAPIIITEVASPEVDEVIVTGDSTADAEGAVSITKEFLYEVSYVDIEGNQGVSVEVLNSSSTTTGASVTTAPSNGSFQVTFTASDTYTITVTSTEDNTKSDSTTIVVSNIYVPVLTDYELYAGTTVSDSKMLTEGDYVIYYNGKAMKAEISGDRAQYEEVTPSNDVISTADSSIVWHIAPVGSYYTIYNASENKYLASTGAKNKAQLLTDGTDDRSLWTVSIDNDTFEFVNKQNTTNGVNANLRENGTYGFACYATNIGGALSLYKKAYDANGYADLFLNTLSLGANKVCDASGNTNVSKLSAAWAMLSVEYGDLDSSIKTTYVEATADESGTKVEKAVALYDYVAKKYNTQLGNDYNFMSRSSANASNSINPINKVNNTVAIVVVVTISLVSVSALGAYFLLRKKKEER